MTTVPRIQSYIGGTLFRRPGSGTCSKTATRPQAPCSPRWRWRTGLAWMRQSKPQNGPFLPGVCADRCRAGPHSGGCRRPVAGAQR